MSFKGGEEGDFKWPFWIQCSSPILEELRPSHEANLEASQRERPGVGGTALGQVVGVSPGSSLRSGKGFPGSATHTVTFDQVSSIAPLPLWAFTCVHALLPCSGS